MTGLLPALSHKHTVWEVLFALWKLNPRIVKNGCQVILSLQSQPATHRERGIFWEPNIGGWEPSGRVSAPPHTPRTVLGTLRLCWVYLEHRWSCHQTQRLPYWSIKR